MPPSWKDFLTARGAAIDDKGVAYFHELDLELKAVKSGTVLADLSHYALIAASGEEAQNFLHGQLTNDVEELDGSNVQLSGYCSPKGRLFASFLLWKQDNRYLIQLPAELRESIQKRLSMFVLRAKVKLADASDDLVRMGIAGPAAVMLIPAATGVSAPEANRIARGEQVTVLGLGRNRFEILSAPANAPRIWAVLSENAVEAGAARWDWLAIRAGEPVITSATQEQFVPQMANFELAGGVNFRKGCYPGQEIVARTQYLGKLKRRMFLANIATDAVVPGDELFSTGLEGQAVGMIVNATPSPDGGFDALTVIQVETAAQHPVHHKSPTGPTLKLLTLPYTVQ